MGGAVGVIAYIVYMMRAVLFIETGSKGQEWIMNVYSILAKYIYLAKLP